MPSTDRDRTIALAGLFQAAGLVRDIARDGQFDYPAFEASVGSIFKIDADNSEDVYGGLDRIRPGLLLLERQLRQPQNPEPTRYVLLLMVLERKLFRQSRLLDALQAGIKDTRDKLNHFPATHENIIARLADLYASTISTLKPRVMVNGDYRHLSQTDNANRIRALLMAGIRAAVLWRQSGGGRLTLLFGRKRLLATAQQLLEQLDQATANA